MPPKKTRKPKPVLRTTLRLTKEELAPLEADRLQLAAGSIPIRMGAYLKYAAMSYPRLRQAAARIGHLAAHNPTLSGEFVLEVLKEYGL